MSAPQIIAAGVIVVAGLSAWTWTVIAIRRAIQATGGFRYAGAMAARLAGPNLISAIAMPAWAALLWWGGFWS